LAAAEETPHAIICGYPIYDESVPDIRRKGREFSNGWARFVTLNHEIKDSLCGFRIYPLESYARILGGHSILSRRMGYDVDILVQMLWQGLPIVNMGVHVTYPEDGISNFRMFHDNLDISLTYTRLCAGMLIRLPLLAWRSWKRRHP
ncbi:MAG: glycosyltransferase family 2 protein, partial [Treponema sp.]|nr:glycosyltransferase family 2 protein [Treponema sp.]